MLKPRIVFMGTPEFAVASLEALVRGGCDIAAVITAPDKPAGRGMQVTESAVKKFAKQHSLNLLQPEKLKNEQFINELKLLNADMFVVVAFRMLPEIVWNMPPMGTINLHGSMLPQYRGAAPINWAIINGEKETGVTTFKLTHEIDTGNILLSQTIPIGDDETAGELHDRMKMIGAALLLKTVEGVANNTLLEIPQTRLIADSGKEIKHAPKLFSDTCSIDWTKSVQEIHNLVRGLSPYPGAFTRLKGKSLKIYRTGKNSNQPSIAQGEYETDHKTYLRFAASDGFIEVRTLQLEGKKRIEVEEFLRGWREDA